MVLPCSSVGQPAPLYALAPGVTQLSWKPDCLDSPLRQLLISHRHIPRTLLGALCFRVYLNDSFHFETGPFDSESFRDVVQTVEDSQCSVFATARSMGTDIPPLRTGVKPLRFHYARSYNDPYLKSQTISLIRQSHVAQDATL